MTDRELNFQTMALNVAALLQRTRPEWEPLYARLLPDYEALTLALSQTDTQARQLQGGGSQGYTAAKDRAEVAALDAAVPVLRGLRAVQLDAPRPELARLAGLTRSGLDGLRDLTQVATLEELHTRALPLAPELAAERVTAQHLTALQATTATLKQLVGAPRQQIAAGATRREQVVAALQQARAALKRLDVRVPNLEEELPELVATYRRTRLIVDAGGTSAAGSDARASN